MFSYFSSVPVRSEGSVALKVAFNRRTIAVLPWTSGGMRRLHAGFVTPITDVNQLVRDLNSVYITP